MADDRLMVRLFPSHPIIILTMFLDFLCLIFSIRAIVPLK